jgi:hypothetical protein
MNRSDGDSSDKWIFGLMQSVFAFNPICPLIPRILIHIFFAFNFILHNIYCADDGLMQPNTPLLTLRLRTPLSRGEIQNTASSLCLWHLPSPGQRKGFAGEKGDPNGYSSDDCGRGAQHTPAHPQAPHSPLERGNTKYRLIPLPLASPFSRTAQRLCRGEGRT